MRLPRVSLRSEIRPVVTSPGPALFRHRRVGFRGKHFDCLKFRTMVTDAPERLRQLLDSDPVAAAEWTADHVTAPYRFVVLACVAALCTTLFAGAGAASVASAPVIVGLILSAPLSWVTSRPAGVVARNGERSRLGPEARRLEHRHS